MSNNNLVIVESPSKAKTIEKYLGADYTVRSSFGHIRDLAKKGLGVDIVRGFTPDYEIAADKQKIVKELSSMASTADTVWLASDEDREGEAIAWHLSQVLKLPADKTRRIVFHEITKPAILNAIENPRGIDMDLVNAQQARRILDRLVGFELSPLLWKKVKPSLSAGRVQSVTVRLIVEREREIMGFKSIDYWRVTAEFYPAADPSKTMFTAEASKRFDTRQEAEDFLAKCNGAVFTVSSSEEKPGTRHPAPPFTTSTLQQEAGRKFNMSVKQTMIVAQDLYEQGLITYMRTDSVNLSAQAIAASKEEVVKLFGEGYSNSRNYKTKSKGAQEAHEAIRPSYFDRRTIEGNANEKRLYELIWKRAVASQMKPAEIDRTAVHIDAGGAKEHFVATGEVVRFDGFLKLYSEGTDDGDNGRNEPGFAERSHGADGAEGVLPKMDKGDNVVPTVITATQRFTQPPARYNEALLVKRLEELGIGRPSTYAPTISTVINRGYVVKQNKEGANRDYTRLTLKNGKITEKGLSEKAGKEDNRLAPTDIGMLVNDYLEGQFAEILDYNFTAKVEKEFDEIAEGNEQWGDMIARFYAPFHTGIERAMGEEHTDTQKVRILGVDPKTGGAVSARIGRFGPMVQLETAEGEKPRSASLKKGQLIISITLEDALQLLSLPRTLGSREGKDVVVAVGRFGPYVNCDGKFTSLERGDDPYTITLERALTLIEAKAAASKPLKTFDEEPDLVVKSGKYGPYIAYKGTNYKIPKGAEASELTLEDVRNIVANEANESQRRPRFNKKR